MNSASASATPAKTPSRFMCDATLIDSPLPQASSTVDRRNQDLIFMPQMSNLEQPPKGHQSPAYLVHAINEMRELTDKLGIIPDNSQSVFKMPKPIPSDNPLRRSASLADFPEGRESIVTESDADSSLGILRLENEPGYSETEDMGKPSEVFAHLRRGHIQTDSHSSHESIPHPAIKTNPHQISSEMDVQPSAGRKFSQFAPFDNLSLPAITASNLSHDMEADLRLRLQKALAQRTIDRSMDSSVRMSQLSDLINDSISSTGSNGQPMFLRPDESQRMPVGFNFPSSSTFSPTDGGSFGAENFMLSLNKSQNPQDSLSSESFQPAEAAMARLEQDENSWRRQFDDLPIDLQHERHSENSLIKNSEQIQHLTQNLELSSFSGIINGDISLNLSQMEGSDKRRISMGEYFKLFSEKLGGEVEVDEDDEQRPNFGKVITSPTRKRPHPPLVNVSTSQVSPSNLDEVPTRDAGLNATIRSSILSFDLSATAEIDASASKKQDSLQTSRDLMPPPLAPVVHKQLSGSPVSETVASRLSTSLPLYKDADDCTNNDADISSFSMDRRWKASNVASISHIARYISEMPKSVSTRCLVDNLMKEFASDLPKDISEQETAAVFSTVHTDNMTEQKVNEWMSSLRRDSYSTIDNDSSIDSDQQSFSRRFESSFKDVADTESSAFYETDKPHVRSVCKPLKQGKMVVMSSGVTSDPPLPSLANNPSFQGVRRSHSTPKLHSRVLPRLEARHEGGSKSDVENQQAAYKAKDFLSRASIGSFTESRKGQLRSRSLNTQLGGGHQSTRPMSKESLKMLSSSSQDSTKSVIPTEHFQQSIKQENATKHRKSGSTKSPAKSEAYSPSLVGSVCSGTKNSSRGTEATSVGSTPLQVDSTHTQLSWASVQLGSSVTQTFALRNRAPARTRLLVSSTHPAFKLMGERGESLSDLTMTLHPEETRRIHVIFTPSHLGPVVGKLIIRRTSTSESSSSTSGDRRLIPLYAFGGVAELSIDGASKDRWSQLFLNMSVPDVDGQSEVSDADTTSDQQMLAFFNIRNIGSVSAFVSLQVEPTELPFEDCGVYVTPTSILLTPGQSERVCVRFEPNHDVLLWLNNKAEDMQLLANLWLSWSELAVWQRIRRVFLKHCGKKEGSRLSKWGCLYTGDLGVANELRDKQYAETVLSQAVHRIKVAVLVEREKLNAFDLDTTLVFQQLIANESSMLISPPEAERASNAVCGRESPLLAGNLHGLLKKQLLSENQPAASHSPNENVCLSSDLIIYTNVIPQSEELCSVQFPKTLCEHKSSVKVRFLNPSSESCQVSAQGAVYPFTVSTADFNVQGGSYLVMRILFKPQTAGSFHCKIDIFVNEIKVRCYQLQGEGVGERDFLT